MIYASLVSQNFEFYGIFEDDDAAHIAFQKAWITHASQTGATDDWDVYVDDLDIHSITPGIVYRDGSPLGGSAGEER